MGPGWLGVGGGHVHPLWCFFGLILVPVVGLCVCVRWAKRGVSWTRGERFFICWEPMLCLDGGRVPPSTLQDFLAPGPRDKRETALSFCESIWRGSLSLALARHSHTHAHTVTDGHVNTDVHANKAS